MTKPDRHGSLAFFQMPGWGRKDENRKRTCTATPALCMLFESIRRLLFSLWSCCSLPMLIPRNCLLEDARVVGVAWCSLRFPRNPCARYRRSPAADSCPLLEDWAPRTRPLGWRSSLRPTGGKRCLPRRSVFSPGVRSWKIHGHCCARSARGPWSYLVMIGE